MKTKTIILAIILVSSIAFFSFKNIGESDSSNIALVSLVTGKGDNEGFLITYGDGTSELKPFKFKMTSMEDMLKSQGLAAVVLNQLHEKGYRYVAMGSTFSSYMVFEKK